MPAEIVQRLNSEIAAAIKLQDVRDRLAAEGVDARSSTPDELARLMVTDIKRWGGVIERIGVRLE
jgi:tripartite-type tricarboxylate transporter receptor subunit TctC